jgi:hypothetical protein
MRIAYFQNSDQRNGSRSIDFSRCCEGPGDVGKTTSARCTFTMSDSASAARDYSEMRRYVVLYILFECRERWVRAEEAIREAPPVIGPLQSFRAGEPDG